MSPEQARGHTVDKRADIWAFGCVLYEMLTGRQAFGGETVSDTIAAVLDREPDWNRLPAKTPPEASRLLHRCLDKDLKRRLHDIADARIELDEGPSTSPPAPRDACRAPSWRGPPNLAGRTSRPPRVGRRRQSVLLGGAAVRGRREKTATTARISPFIRQPPIHRKHRPITRAIPRTDDTCRTPTFKGCTAPDRDRGDAASSGSRRHVFPLSGYSMVPGWNQTPD